MTTRQWLLLLVAVALGGALGATLLARWWARLRFARRRRRGRRGEERAPAVLQAAGYRVVAEQPEQPALLRVDQQDHPYTLRADFLAEKGRTRFAVEVKTGKKAPNPQQAATRRQLLEYRLLYDVDGVLLVDMEAERVHEIRWPDLAPPERRGAASAWLWGAAVGLLIGAALGFWLGR